MRWDDSMPFRLVRLLVGLVLYGAGVALTVEAALGLDPWTVLAEGVSLQTHRAGWGIDIGWTTNLLGVLVLLAWIPLRQRPGVGTVLNVLLVGTSMQVTLDLVPAFDGIAWRILSLLGGIALVALASAVYIGASLGPGPRDGLMTGLHARLGWPVWRARAAVELTVLALGWLLGGTVGWGTLAFATLIGPLVHLAMHLLRVDRAEEKPATAPEPATPL